MARPHPLPRQSSTPWDRLKSVKQDPLESMGFVSKGDKRLLDVRHQESYYQKIVDRYMQFLSDHRKDLDAAFASLSIGNNATTSSDPTKNPAVPSIDSHKSTSSTTTAATELSTILMALRKLREGLLGSSSNHQNHVFSQRVHIFNIRAAILAMHPPSYHSSLSYLLFVLHTTNYPLPRSELIEMTTYAILDRALRQDDMIQAYALKHQSKQSFGYANHTVDAILRAVVTNNWVQFWRLRAKVDGHVRAIMRWYVESSRKTTLKVFGRAYLKCDVRWLMWSAVGSEMTWEELVEKEQIGWIREGDVITIRKPKPR